MAAVVLRMTEMSIVLVMAVMMMFIGASDFYLM